jgi:hypothetical protein
MEKLTIMWRVVTQVVINLNLWGGFMRSEPSHEERGCGLTSHTPITAKLSVHRTPLSS